LRLRLPHHDSIRYSAPRKTLRPYRASLLISLVVTAGALSEPALAQLENNRRPPRPDVTLPDGPARRVVLASCTQCHGIDEYGYYAMDREHWAAVIERMKTAKSGVVEGTTISDEDREILLDWLAAEFGPDSEPLRRQYVIRPLEPSERLDDETALAKLETGCTECHSLDSVRDARLDAEQIRERMTLEISRGAGVLIADAEPLVQWLLDREPPRF
jgi:mono/diheme cytochrome c family protein